MSTAINFKIIVNCGPCEEYIGTCLESVMSQSVTAWEAFVTVDPCGDGTFERASRETRGDARIHVKRNETRLYSLCNLVTAIRESNAEPEDVIVVLDGDDWFATEHALLMIACVYENFDCWMTYGSWLSNVPRPDGRRDGLWPAYPEGTTRFRHTRWLGTAVRTWKKWLWDHIEDADLRNDSGEYFRVSEDQAVMLPLLEMCGTSKAKHVSEPIMVYNKKVKYKVDGQIAEESARNAHLLDIRPPYPRLESKVLREVAAAGA